MNTYYFDWAGGKVDVLRNDDTTVTIYHDLDELLDAITKPSLIIGEATFESFWRETKRNDFIERCAREGHDLRTVPTRGTGQWKLREYPPEQHPQFYGKNAKFPDDLACDLIRQMYRDGVHLKKPRLYDPDDPHIAVRKSANHELMILRNTKKTVIGPRGGRNLVSAKDEFATELIATLPAYQDLSDVQKVALGNGKEYSKPIVAAVGMATKYAKSTKDFDRLSGMNHHGYPSQIRSDLHLHGWWKTPKGKIPKREQIKLTDYRREIRWLYHQLKVTASLTP